MTRRLLVVSSGSWEASILGRNALGRLLTIRETGLFDEVDYVFFPAGVRAFREVEPGFRVHELPGRPDGHAPPGWRSRARGVTDGWRELREIARRSPPTVVNSVEPFLSGLLAAALAREAGVPFVATLVSNYRLSWKVGRLNPIPFLPPPLTFAVERHLLGAAARVHVDCHHYAEYAVERGAAGKKLRVIPRYADPVFYETEPDREIWTRVGVADPAPLVYVGRLSPEKYALDLADAFLRVVAHRPSTRLVVLGGGGPDSEPFRARIEAGGAWDRVHLVTGLSRPDLLSAMGTAGALLATHAGYALLEAALAGAPVVAFDYEWHPELIVHGRTGLLVPWRNGTAMGDAALSLLEDGPRARTLAGALRDRARSGYRVEDHVAALTGSYGELLGVRSGA